nr:MAG TPA: hypothetical protein [Crassvirales sp.]
MSQGFLYLILYIPYQKDYIVLYPIPTRKCSPFAAQKLKIQNGLQFHLSH